MRRSESDTRTHSCHKNTLALDEYRWFISSGKGARVSLWHCSLCVCGGGGAGGLPGKAKAQGQAARGPSRARPALARAPGPLSPGRTAPQPCLLSRPHRFRNIALHRARQNLDPVILADGMQTALITGQPAERDGGVLHCLALATVC